MDKLRYEKDTPLDIRGQTKKLKSWDSISATLMFQKIIGNQPLQKLNYF